MFASLVEKLISSNRITDNSDLQDLAKVSQLTKVIPTDGSLSHVIADLKHMLKK